MKQGALDFFRSQMASCELCPRRCGVDRLAGEVGFCGATAEPKVASHCLHVGEEPPISGTRGSGTIFFSHCNMACVYCQNYPISQMGHGNTVTTDVLAGMMVALQTRGAHNINLVTPTHFLSPVVEAITKARANGLAVPIVYNTSGYERPEVIGMLDGIVQIFLPDMRYATAEAAAKYSGAPDYPDSNRGAVIAMLSLVGHLRCQDGLARSGVVIRHLLLPSLLEETRQVLAFISDRLSRETAISLMSQYFPANRAHLFPELDRKVTEEERNAAVALLEEFGLDNGWVQDSDAPASPVA